MHNVTFIPFSNQLMFYPIGNTPAVNLLCHHSPKPDKDATTDILSLACGDARSILYSLWCEGKPGMEKFSFTACDLEPAVLARNVLLLSLMLDNAGIYTSCTSDAPDPRLAMIWNLWYHFYLPKHDLEVLQEQAAKLLSYSETAEKWASSPFSCIAFVSLQSLDELRKVWAKYALKRSPMADSLYELSTRSKIKKMNELYKDGGTSMTFYAGPHWEKGLNTMNKSLRGYWSTGVVSGNKADVAALGSDKKGVVNPLIAVSSVSEDFAVHFTSDPLTSFHLASVFDGKSKPDKDIEAMATLAKTQFQQWSKAFVEYASKGSVRVNIYYGDAVTFCHELAARTTNEPGSAPITRAYTTQWSAKPLLFDGEGGKTLPKFFDIIDTSNLADWVGHYNILIPTSQILARKDTSVLFTETFRLTAIEPDDDLYEQLFLDVDVASLFIGIAPLGHLLGYSTENSIGEDIVHLDNPRRYRMRIPWKFVLDHHTKDEIVHPTRDWRVQFDADELAEIFFEVYLKMFSNEDLSGKVAKIHKMNPNSMHAHVLSRFTRLSFATLIRHTMRNIVSDWKKFFAKLFDKIERDKLLDIGENCMLDLVLQLSLCGALSNAFTKTDPKPNPRQFKQVTLVVPRSELQVFEQLGSAPGIHLDVYKNGSMNLFFSIDCFFGRIKKGDDGSWAEVTEDPKGWAGVSDLIITTPVPPELVETGKFDVALHVTISGNAAKYMGVLGPEMCVYMTSTKGKKKRVIVSDSPPRIGRNRPIENGSDANQLSQNSLSFNSEQNQEITVSASTATGPLVFKAKWTIAKDSGEAIALGKAAFVTLTDNSPCSILLKIGEEYGRRLIFPFPIHAEKAKARIARKSLWIEVSVPAASTLVPGGYDLTPFPVVIEDDAQPSSWSLPRFDLSKLPRIATMKDTSILEDFEDSVEHFLSVREKSLLRSSPLNIAPDAPFRDVLPVWKKTLWEMMMDAVRVTQTKIFVLTGPKNLADIASQMDTFIVVNCLRHGRETGTLVLDGWMVPIDLGRNIEPVSGVSSLINLEEPETFIWKNILPAAVESARRTWMHGEGCEYLKEKKVPRSVKQGENPICTCGEGKDVEEYPKEMFVGPLIKYATRIAIPMLSAVNYVESMDPRVSHYELSDDE